MNKEQKYWKGYYEGQLNSLKHNVLLILNQMEGNKIHAKEFGVEIKEYMKVIKKRIKEIK